jgi:hypothetical protein
MMLQGTACFIAAALNAIGGAGELNPPVKLTAAGEPIDVQRTAHAAPFFGDFNGDGRDDLLVGEFHEGRMRVFLNIGSNEEPVFDKFEWFTAGAELGRVPTG